MSVSFTLYPPAGNGQTVQSNSGWDDDRSYNLTRQFQGAGAQRHTSGVTVDEFQRVREDRSTTSGGTSTVRSVTEHDNDELVCHRAD